MDLMHIVLLCFFFVVLFWFRKILKLNDSVIWLVGILSLAGGIFSAKLILFILQHIDISNQVWYSAIFGPTLEEVIKFIIIIFLISTIKDFKTNPNWGLSIGVLVGLGFGIYENYIYIQSGVDNIWVILYRSLFVGGILLHPLTSGIAGYMFHLSYRVNKLMPGVFKESKSNFRGLSSIFALGGLIYKNTEGSIVTLFKFIKGLFALDVVTKYLLGNNSSSFHGRGPTEIVYEGMILALWIHILYNSLLTYISTPDWLIVVVSCFIVFMLFRVFIATYGSFLLGSMVGLVILGGLFLPGEIGSKLLLFGLVFLMINMLILSFNINKKLSRVE